MSSKLPDTAQYRLMDKLHRANALRDGKANACNCLTDSHSDAKHKDLDRDECEDLRNRLRNEVDQHCT